MHNVFGPARFFCVRLPLRFPDDDPLPPPAPPPVVVVPPAPGRPRTVECACCGSQLGLDGGVIVTGERARKLARVEDQVSAKDEKIRSLESQLETVRGELGALKAATEVKSVAAGGGDRWWK